LHFDFRLKLALSVLDSLLSVNNKMLLFYSTLMPSSGPGLKVLSQFGEIRPDKFKPVMGRIR